MTEADALGSLEDSGWRVAQGLDIVPDTPNAEHNERRPGDLGESATKRPRRTEPRPASRGVMALLPRCGETSRMPRAILMEGQSHSTAIGRSVWG